MPKGVVAGMEDLSKILSSLSGDDINMLKGMADSILGGGAENSQPESRPATAAEPAPSQGGTSPFGNGFNLGTDELSMIMKVKSAYEKMNQNGSSNENSQLILALKPHLSEARQRRADEAMQLMRMFDMLPLLKELF